MNCNRCGISSDDAEGWSEVVWTQKTSSAFDICPECIGAVVDALIGADLADSDTALAPDLLP